MFESIANWYRTHVQSSLSETSENIAQGASDITGGAISTERARSVVPLAAAGAAVGSGVLLFPLIEKGCQWLFRSLGKAFTGFGLLEKIPVVGGALSAVGSAVGGLGKYAAYPIVAIGGLLGYSAFSARPASTPASESVPPVGGNTSVTPQTPVMRQAKVVDPETKRILASEDIPQEPPLPKPLSEAAKRTLSPLPGLQPQTPKAEQINTATDLRELALSEKNTKVEEALREYIVFVNQRYENTRAWIDAAETYRNGPRKKLVAALQEIGLTEQEAMAFVPEPPALQKTVYSDGTDFHPQLLAFVNQFTSLYGATGPQGESARSPDGRHRFRFADTPNETPKPKPFEQCSMTQKEEFIANAIEYFKARKKFFEVDHVSVHNIYWADIPINAMKCGEARTPNYTDENKPWKNWLTPTEGTNEGIPWSQEHAALKKIGVGGARLEVLPGIAPIDENTSAESKLATLLESHNKQRMAAQAHKVKLENANNSEIAQWSRSVENMLEKLEGIKTHGVVVLSHNVHPSSLEHTLEVKDILSDATPLPTLTIRLKQQADNTYQVIAWNEGSKERKPEEGERLTLTSPTDAQQLRSLLERIRPLHAELMAQAASQRLELARNLITMDNSEPAALHRWIPTLKHDASANNRAIHT